MKQFALATAMLCLVFSAVHSQSAGTTVEIDDKMQPGLVLDIPNNTETAEGTLLQKLKETGYKPETSGSMFWKSKKRDGFYVFNGVQLPDLGNRKLDLYFKVDQKGKNADNLSTMYMLVSSGYDNFISAASDSATFASATTFLNGFIANTADYSLQQDILAKEKLLSKAEKKMSDLEDDDKSMRKKIEQLNQDLRDNEASRQQQAAEISSQRSTLDALKSKVRQ